MGRMKKFVIWLFLGPSLKEMAIQWLKDRRLWREDK